VDYTVPVKMGGTETNGPN